MAAEIGCSSYARFCRQFIDRNAFAVPAIIIVAQGQQFFCADTRIEHDHADNIVPQSDIGALVERGQKLLQCFNWCGLDVAIVPPFAKLVDFDGIFADMTLLDQPIQKSVDILKGLIIAGRGGIRDCGEKGEHIIFKLCFVQTVAAVL